MRTLPGGAPSRSTRRSACSARGPNPAWALAWLALRRLFRASGSSTTRRVRRSTVIAPLVIGCTVLSACLLAGCSGGSGQLRGSVYRDREATYRVGSLSREWQRLSVEDQNDLAWSHAASASIVQVNSTCDPASDVPLSTLTNHLLMGFTDRDIRDQEIVPMDEREALRTHVVARLDGVPRELLLYVMKKDDCVYDLALLAPVGASFERSLVEFEPFVAGFSTETGRAGER